ncbi:cold-shock protein [Rhizobium sp. P32RR-XVIII]|uniref:cold-shock protein n=1 Tax=Rhizobium sp. P32RR-XVIII TaxID=2726738 RepID=UPI00391815A7
MSKPNYKVGDFVVLKSGLTRTAAADRRCEVVGILPNDHGQAQYRVRFEAENFERRITALDIDASESPPGVADAQPIQTSETGPWLKTFSTKMRK